MTGRSMLSTTTTIITFLLLKHWWADRQVEPPFEIVGGVRPFWEFASGAALILDKYHSCCDNWVQVATEYTDHLIAIFDEQHRRPQGKEMHGLAQQTVAKYVEAERLHDALNNG